MKIIVQGVFESSKELESCLKDWDSNNHIIITWVINNTSIASTIMSFVRLETTKEVWYF